MNSNVHGSNSPPSTKKAQPNPMLLLSQKLGMNGPWSILYHLVPTISQGLNPFWGSTLPSVSSCPCFCWGGRVFVFEMGGVDCWSFLATSILNWEQRSSSGIFVLFIAPVDTRSYQVVLVHYCQGGIVCSPLKGVDCCSIFATLSLMWKWSY